MTQRTLARAGVFAGTAVAATVGLFGFTQAQAQPMAMATSMHMSHSGMHMSHSSMDMNAMNRSMSMGTKAAGAEKADPMGEKNCKDCKDCKNCKDCCADCKDCCQNCTQGCDKGCGGCEQCCDQCRDMAHCESCGHSASARHETGQGDCCDECCDGACADAMKEPELADAAYVA